MLRGGGRGAGGHGDTLLSGGAGWLKGQQTLGRGRLQKIEGCGGGGTGRGSGRGGGLRYRGDGPAFARAAAVEHRYEAMLALQRLGCVAPANNVTVTQSAAEHDTDEQLGTHETLKSMARVRRRWFHSRISRSASGAPPAAAAPAVVVSSVSGGQNAGSALAAGAAFFA